MPTEHRLIAALVLLGALASVVIGSWHDLPPLGLVIAATSIVSLGLLPPTPRMVNAIAAVVGGALVTFLALRDGGSTGFVIVVPLVAASVLLLGVPGFGWTVALSLASMLVLGVDLGARPRIAQPVDMWAMIVVAAWAAWLVLTAVRHLIDSPGAWRTWAVVGACVVGTASLPLHLRAPSIAIVACAALLALCHAYIAALPAIGTTVASVSPRRAPSRLASVSRRSAGTSAWR